ncbi:NAD(P)/FAD-dependent oxidoreductase [Streptomyces sp. NBC_01525]|uniref:NAD(P)/FAD-dependent oxidoreductase n=1 Tax=Streptomyces sp. NBC_01525 TaxID=2903893 RepID=UPI00117EA9A5|nr:FAD/NAD(P)-binding oxidoreductase [Streptomyces benahoarensis]TSB17945.1 NAD(P)/FAD-dependent oxidoreductase [Streptomyces benahoarensis]
MHTVTVIGASLAGLYAARALRAEGYAGRLVLVGEERHRPYDRPPLSKAFLTGAADADALALADDEETAGLALDLRTGARAVRLDPRARSVTLASGEEIRTDGVVLATGAAPRTLPGPVPGKVHTLRTLDDARALRAALTAGPVRVVVIGGGFLGAETASSCAALGHDVTVVEAAPLPLVPQLGEAMAGICAALHADHGVRLLTGTGVAGLRADGAADAVTAVALADGRLLPAEVVVVAIGVRPRTGWLAGSGLPLDDGVCCDAGGVTPLPQVVAAGDVARTAGARSEHWTAATEQAAVCARNLLAGRTEAVHRSLPYFWSEQYGVRLQFAGRRSPGDVPRVVEGSPDDRTFLAVYERDGRPTAALALNRPRPFARLRREWGRAADPVG